LSSVPLIKLFDDLLPATRRNMTIYHLQIGDCVFSVPPESISVKQVNSIHSYQGLRQKNSILTNSGFTQTEVRVKLWFNDLNDINGVEVAGPGGRRYWMDGLRPLIAQFRCTPILPVFNELLNDVHDIYTVILSNIVVQTVPDFPGALEADLILYKTTIEPYMYIPDYKLADYICWPIFRWYYQRLMTGEDVECLEQVTEPCMTERYIFSVLDESVLIEGSAGGNLENTANLNPSAPVKISSGYEIVQIDGLDRSIMPARKLASLLGKTIEWKSPNVIIGGKSFRPYKIVDGTAWVLVRQVGEVLGYRVDWDDSGVITLSKSGTGSDGSGVFDIGNNMVQIDLPDDLVLTHMVVGMGNSFANLNVQSYTMPCHQYLGSMEKQIIATFETPNRDAILLLQQMVEITNDYSIKYRNRFVSGFVGFNNELAALFGMKYAMVQSIQVDTIEGMPGLFRVALSMIGFDRMQRNYEQTEALKYINNTLETIAGVNVNDMTEIEHACLVEEMLDGFDLYPDLPLPTYYQLAAAIDQINQQRNAYGLPALSFQMYTNPAVERNPNILVDPDFYIDYSHWGDISSQS